MKKLSSQSLIGQQGVNLVERIVLEMKYAWRPTPVFDVGIDGEIEVCDPVTGEATNSYIKVQRSTLSYNNFSHCKAKNKSGISSM